MSRLIATTILVLGLFASVVPASAQVCGDADGNGSVGVSDGVQTLRAAAILSTICTLAACDVDGNGQISVTDGVNVLRKAASLPIVENCSGEPVAGQPATILKELQPILKRGVGFATGTTVTTCANGEAGEVEVTVDGDETTTNFTSCQVDDVLFYNDIIVSPSLLVFSVFETDTLDDEIIADFDGELTLGTSGGGRSLTGSLDGSTESAGFFTVTFEGAVVVGGVLTGGRATVALEDSDIADQFTALALTFDGSGIANVNATPAGGGGAQTFRFDIANGTLQ